MKQTLIAIGSGLFGCALAVALVVSGIALPPAPEPVRSAAAPSGEPAADRAAELASIKEENARLSGEVRGLRAQLEGIIGDMAKARDAARRPDAPATPSKEGEPAVESGREAGFTSEDVLWMRLFIRAIKPMLYGEAVEQMRSLCHKMYGIYNEKQSISGVTLQTIWPDKEGKRSRSEFWYREDFAIAITGSASGEIELVGDPATPRLKMFFDFNKRMDFTWSREIPGITSKDEDGEIKRSNSEEARASEARACCGALKDRARVVYQRNPESKLDMEALGIGKTELNGSYFTYDDYEVSGTPEEFTVRCKNVYSDEPYDLICTCNLKTGEAKFNR